MRTPHLPATLLCGIVVATTGATRVHDEGYATGKLGVAPVQTFYSVDLTPPELNLYKTPPTRVNASAEAPLLTFLGYRGHDAVQAGPVILNDWGELIWHGPEYGNVLNVERHRYLGEEVFSFYTGTEQFPGYGNGQWNLLNSAYEVVATVKAQNTSKGLDPHDLFILDDIATVEFWTPAQTDLSGLGGPQDGWVYDCRVQSINISSGELLFEWSSLAHVSVEDTYYSLGEREGEGGNGWDAESPFDYFHLNSVQRDAAGNYVLGARGPATVYYVDGGSGEVLWRLGGRNSSFTMREGVHFWFQHHARAVVSGPDTYNISLFDNGANQYESRSVQARGVVVEVNTRTMDTRLLRQVLPTFHDVCPSEGSVQTFDDGRIVVGWGIRPYYTEFDATDQVLHDVQFGTDQSTVHSYSAFKASWIAHPKTIPSFVMTNNSAPEAYVSWNGATEVATWAVLGGKTPMDLVEVSINRRKGFETKLNVSVLTDFIAVAAHDASGNCLAVSEVFGYANASTTGLTGGCPQPDVQFAGRNFVAAGAFTIIVLVCFVAFTRILPACWTQLQAERGYQQLPGNQVSPEMPQSDSDAPFASSELSRLSDRIELVRRPQVLQIA